MLIQLQDEGGAATVYDGSDAAASERSPTLAPGGTVSVVK